MLETRDPPSRLLPRPSPLGEPAPGSRRTGAAALGLLALLLASGPRPLAGQEADSLRRQIEESQQRLEQIQEEQSQLRREMRRLSERVSTVREEMDLLEQQIGASVSALSELDVQIRTVGEQVEQTTKEMLRTRDRLRVRKTELRQRLREVYKRGPLGPVRVLFAARSFSDLINRYKYLHLVTIYDRMLVRDVSQLEQRLASQREELATVLDRLRRLRRQKRDELNDLEELERQRQRRLARYRRQESRVEGRIARLEQEEAKLRGLIAELERLRREAERRAGRPSRSSLRTSDLGQLDWPVQGEVAYRFGPDRDGELTVQREGVGIRAPRGSPVRAVESGQVEWAGRRGVYGPSVVVSHGGGYYSVYLYLQNLRVAEGERVESGQVLGGVGTGGGAGGPAGSHVEFQIWEPGADGAPRAVDPVRWLRERS